MARMAPVAWDGMGWHGIASDGMGGMRWHRMPSDGTGWH